MRKDFWLAGICALLLSAGPASAQTVDSVAKKYGLAGEILVGRDGRVTLHRAYGTIDPKGARRHRVGERWRLASITKQVAAAILARSFAPQLDVPLSATGRPVQGSADFGGLTLRQLLTHHSGLSNPDDSPAGAGGTPSFYTSASDPWAYCSAAAPKVDRSFHYINCDYIYASRHFGGITDWPAGMTMAKPGETGIPGFVHGAREPGFELRNWGAAGGLVGTLRSIWNFDLALMTGRFVPDNIRTQLWTAEGSGSYQALGAWVFPFKLQGCDEPVTIIQRDGEIQGVQARNFIVPERKLAIIVFTNRSADDFALGEVWQQSGFVYELLSAAVCGPR